jgi:hypothetical protein
VLASGVASHSRATVNSPSIGFDSLVAGRDVVGEGSSSRPGMTPYPMLQDFSPWPPSTSWSRSACTSTCQYH